MPREDSLEDVKNYLEQWGEWLRDGAGHRLGYPTKTNFSVESAHELRVYDCDVAELVERCMCELKSRHFDWYETLYFYYYYKLPIFEAAQKCKLSKTVYKTRREKGEAWVECCYLQKEFKKVA